MQISAISAVTSFAPASVPPVARNATTTSPTLATTTTAAAGDAADLATKIYSTRVAGKSYSGDVTYASGLYTISVGGLPGADGSGASLLAAENALNAKIDILV